MLRASVRRVPLAGRSQTVCAPEGSSLEQLARIAFPDDFLRRFVVALVDGEEIAPEAWAETFPRAGATISLCVRPGDGDSGAGKFLRTVLQIAVIAAAAWVGAGAGGIFAAGSFEASLAAAGVAMLGNLAINALIPLAPLQARGETPAPFYTVTGARNAARPYSPAPLVLGKHRFFPPLAGRYVQETFGNDVYLRVPFLLGPAPMQVSDLRIGDTPLSSFEGVEIEQRLTADAPPHTLYTGDPDQTAVGAQLTTTFTSRNTALDVDEIEIVTGFRGGLGGYDSKQRKVSRSVSFEVRYRPAGSSEAWVTHRPTVPQANAASGDLGAPYRNEYFDVEGNLAPFVGRLNAMGGVDAGQVTVTRADPGRGFQHRIRFAVPRHPAGYTVELRRTTTESPDPNAIDACWWEILGSRKSFVDPFPERGLATIVLRIKATAQLNGVIDTFNLVAEPLVPRFSAGAKASPSGASAASLTTVGVSRNPAEVALNLYRGPQAARPRPDDRIDWPAWAEAAAWFESQGLHYDEVVDTAIGRGELARRVLSAAHARPIRWGGKLSVIVDRDRSAEAPAQTFSPRNVSNLRWRKSFPLEVHGVRIPFNNAANGWQADEVTLYLDGFDATNATKIEPLAVPGKTDADEVRVVGRQYVNNSLRQTETFSFDMDAEALTCRPGAYALLLHDAIGVGLGAARVLSVETSGGAVAAFTLDTPIVTDPGDTLAGRWRKEDGAGGFAVSTEAAITRDPVNTARFVFTAPVALASAPAAGEPMLVGRTTEVAIPVLVRDVAWDFGHRASIVCVPYAGERFTPDGTPLPPHNPMVSLPAAPRPAAPVQFGAAVANAREIALAFTQPPSPRGVTLTGYDTAIREHGTSADSWQDRGPLPADARVFVAPAGNPGYSYDLRVIAVGRDSGGVRVTSDPLIVSNVAAAGAPPAPAGCAASFATRTSAGGASQLVLTATWTAVEAPDVLDTAIEIRTATGPDVWAEVARGRAINGRVEVHGLQVGRPYVFGFVHHSRRGIASARTAIAEITAPDVLVATAAQAAAPGSPLDTAIGSMASASASAAAAAAAAAAANAAFEASDAILDDVTEALADTEAARDAAQAAEAAAQLARDNAQTQAGYAAGSASAASGSASLAFTHATNSGNSATAASAAQVSARATANRMLPERPGEDPAAFTGAWNLFSGAADLSGGSAVAVAGEGTVWQVSGLADVATKQFLPVVAGRTYRVSHRSRVTTAGAGTNLWQVWLRAFDAAGVYLGAVEVTGAIDTNVTVAEGWQTLSGDITAAAIVGAWPNAAHVRASLRGGQATGAVWQCAFLQLRDVTSEAAAAGSASASAGSASAASASQSAAGASASAANAAKIAAETASGAAESHSESAADARDSAEGHAALASTKASEAAGSALAASGSAAAASGSSSAAGTQATLAGTHATAAQASAVSAQAVANRLLPDRPAVAADFVGTFTPGAPDGAPPIATGTVVNVANEGDVRQLTSNIPVLTRGWLPVLSGRTYRWATRTAVTVDGTDNRLAAGLAVFAADGAYLGNAGYGIVDTAHLAADGWQTHTGDVTGAAILATYPTAAACRAIAYGGRNAGGAASGATWRVSVVQLRDVTSEAAAAGSASASAGSASAASASQSAAGASASAANAAKIAAETASGFASTYATQAADARDDAQGHAAAASAQATLAAGSATAAGGSASAASGSASTANTQAGAALASATAAAASALSAQAAANRVIPSRLAVTEDWRGVTQAGGPDSGTPAPAFSLSTVVNVAGKGDVRRFTGAGSFGTRGWLPVVAGRTYRMVLEWQCTVAGASGNRSRTNFRAFAADGSYLGASGGSSSLDTTVTGAWARRSDEVTAATLLAAFPTAAFVRGTAVVNENGTVSTTEIAALEFTDVTMELAAAGSASVASAQAAAANTWASSASASATLAANYYLNRLGSQLANRPAVGEDFTAAFGSGGTPASIAPLTAGSIVNVANEGDVRQLSGIADIATRGWLPVLSGRTYRITYRARVATNGTDNRLFHGWPVYSSTGAFLGTPGFLESDSSHVEADGWVTRTADITAATILGAYATAAFVRGRVTGGRNGSGTNSGAVWQLVILGLEDVTELVASNAAIAVNTAAIASESSARSSADITINANLGATNATVATHTGAIADINGGAAWLESVVSAGGGDLGAFRLRAGKAGSFIELVSTVLRLANVSNGSVIEVMRAIGGEAYFSRPVSADGGGKRVTIGPGYGSSGSEVVLWFGPDTVAPSSQSRTNGYFALGTDGKIYYGSSEIVPSTAASQVFQKQQSFSGVAVSGGSSVEMVAVTANGVGAGGYLSLVAGTFLAPGVGATLSGGTKWIGEFVFTEQLQSGGTEYDVLVMPVEVEDTGGGLLQMNWAGGDVPWPSAGVAQTLTGDVRYRLRMRRTSGSVNITSMRGALAMQRVPG